MAIPFQWDADHFYELMASARRDDVAPHISQWLDDRGPILEAGCGLGRFVAFMQEQGFRSVIGVDISAEAVDIVNRLAPHLDVRFGDASSLPFPEASMRGVVSLGVLEHCEEGPREALKELRRVMMPDATAIVTVPYLNLVRRIKHAVRGYELARLWRGRRAARSMGGSLDNVVSRSLARLASDTSTERGTKRRRFARWPTAGPFFEYRFRRKEFEAELRAAGLSILEVALIDTVSGLFYEFGRPFVTHTDRGGRTLTRLGRVVDRGLSRWPGIHAHMILFVVRRERASDCGL